MSDIFARTIRPDDFVGGIALADEPADFDTGVGAHWFLCPHCDAKHLAISTVIAGVRRTVTFHGPDAAKIALTIMKGLANG
ncbi:hypothetical protein [Novosphingobium colocasiae]|uniref:hypothetical protein n=1 Tax=Novosphingobium colocasiae TaxID=1256513 RepID=UPI0035B22404